MNHHLKRTLCLTGVSIAALVAVPALAQESDDSAAQSGGLEEIIVTAQKRDQSQQDVPITISTVTAESAKDIGVRGTEGLTQMVPSLQFTRASGNGGAPFLRGVGSTQAAAGWESPVALYVDDVYMGAPAVTVTQFNNIDAIEVLKGPQGTLFGRNATAGVVHVRTRKPSYDHSGEVSVGYGSYNTVDANVYLTGGLSDKVAANLAVTYHDQMDGYGKSLVTGQDVHLGKNFGARLGLLFEPTDNTTILLRADYSREKADTGMNGTLVAGSVAAGGATSPGRYNTYNFTSAAQPIDGYETRAYGASVRIDQDVGDLSLVSITALRHADQNYATNNDGRLPGVPLVLATPFSNYTNSFSQEVQLLSPSSGRFTWILGAMYYRAAAAYNPLDIIGSSQAATGGVLRIESRQVLNSFGVFGEANYELTPTTRLTAGLRYTTDKFDLDVTRRNAANAILPQAGDFEDSSRFSKLTYRAVIDQKLGDDVMVYGSYSRGFKSGGYSLGGPTVVVGGVAQPAAPVRPEVLDAFEVGLKSDLFDRRVRFNAAAFYYDYQDLQVASLNNGVLMTINAAKARIKGLDAELTWLVSDRFTIYGGAALLDAKYKDFPGGPLFVPRPATCTPTPQSTGAPTGGNLSCIGNLAGNRLTRSPKFSGSIRATYDVPTDIGLFSLTGSLYYNSGFAWEPDNRLKQPKYTLAGLNLRWRDPSERYEISVYGRNLLNKYYYSFMISSALRDSGSPEMPRNYGVTLTTKF